MENLNEKFDLDLSFLCTFHGGSILYGLDNKDSDTDYRGIYINTTSHLILGMGIDSKHKKVECKVTDEVDYAFYELRHFMGLVVNGNTQGFECLFAEDHHFITVDNTFQLLVRDNKYHLIDSAALMRTLVGKPNIPEAFEGYCGNELRLATGLRSGVKGGKRNSNIAENGYSPKNFVQLLRLIYAGTEFFKTGYFPVNLREYNPVFAADLLDIKTNPHKYKMTDLVDRVQTEIKDLFEAFENRETDYVSDIELANAILEEMYTEVMGYDLPRGASTAVDQVLLKKNK